MGLRGPLPDLDAGRRAAARPLPTLRERADRPALSLLQDYLRGKALLLVLDNFEQVIDAAPLIADLLAAAARLKVLVTRRTVLHLTGEHEYPVPPLATPSRTEAGIGSREYGLPTTQYAIRNTEYELRNTTLSACSSSAGCLRRDLRLPAGGGVAMPRMGLAWVAHRQCALGRARARRAAVGSPLDPVDQQEFDHYTALARAALGEAAFAVAWAAGQGMTLEEALQFAHEEQDPPCF